MSDSDLRIKRLTETVGFLLSIDIETDIRAEFTSVTHVEAILSLITESNTISLNVDKKTVELLRDFFAHTYNNMGDL